MNPISDATSTRNTHQNPTVSKPEKTTSKLPLMRITASPDPRTLPDGASGSGTGIHTRTVQPVGTDEITSLSADKKSDMAKSLKSANTILVYGFSSTGNGHTGRSTNVVSDAIKEGKLKKGDVLVLNLPKLFASDDPGKPRSNDITKLVQHAESKGINLIVVDAHKTITGHLIKEGSEEGGSDRNAILREFAENARLPAAKISSILDGRLNPGASKAPPQTGGFAYAPRIDNEETRDHTIHPMDLMKSVMQLKGVATDVRVFSDMAPELISAAVKTKEIDSNKIVDQQNHGVMLESGASHSHLAFMSKALGRGKFTITNIGFGERNVIQDTKIELGKLKIEGADITPDTSKKAVHAAFVDKMKAVGREFDPNDLELTTAKLTEGGYILPKDGREVKNVVALYIRGYSPQALAAIKEGISENKDGYNDTMFVFAGGKAAEGVNVLKLAYGVHADTVFTGGSGTANEAWYTAETGKSNAQVMLLPQKDQDEQKVNGERFAEHFKSAEGEVPRQSVIHNVNLVENYEHKASFDAFVKNGVDTADMKYAGNMEDIMTATDKAGTYREEALRTLFPSSGDTRPETTKELEIKELELSTDPITIATRRFAKIAIQAVIELEKKIDTGDTRLDPTANFEVALQPKQKNNGDVLDTEGKISSLQQLANLMDDPDGSYLELKKLLDIDEEVTTTEIVGFSEFKERLNAMLKKEKVVSTDVTNHLLEAFHPILTGF